MRRGRSNYTAPSLGEHGDFFFPPPWNWHWQQYNSLLAFNKESCCNQWWLRCCRLHLPCCWTSWGSQMTHSEWRVRKHSAPRWLNAASNDIQHDDAVFNDCMWDFIYGHVKWVQTWIQSNSVVGVFLSPQQHKQTWLSASAIEKKKKGNEILYLLKWLVFKFGVDVILKQSLFFSSALDSWHRRRKGHLM